MHFEHSLGSASVIGHKDKTGRWKQIWHARFRFPGGRMAEQMPGVKTRDCMMTLAVPICGKCMAALDLEDEARKVALESCRKQDCYRLAVRRCGDILKLWTDEAWAAVANPPAVQPEPVTVAAVVAGPTVDDLLAAWAAHWPAAMDATATVEARRQATSLMRVLAFAFDAWTIKAEGDGRRGVKVGEKQADMSIIGPMALSEALTKASARRYFEQACAAAGVPCSWAPSNARDEYVTINRTLCQARCLFTKLAMEFVYEGRIEVPDCMVAWKAFQLLPEPRHVIEPIVGDDFTRLVEAREGLKEEQPELYLCAKVLMQTGLRSGSVQEMRGDWAVHVNGAWRLHAKEVKNNTVSYSVPITAELAAEIRAAGGGYCFGETQDERQHLVCVMHNAWMKQHIIGPARGSQGNHRLRKTLASALRALGSLDKASEALGHADRAVTEAKYAAVGVNVTDAMRREFAAFLL